MWCRNNSHVSVHVISFSAYEFDYDKIQKWAYIDIALVKVESPYDLNDPDYQLICSYSPSIIPINYDAKRQADNVDALVLGWGHTQFWRQVRFGKEAQRAFLNAISI